MEISRDSGFVIFYFSATASEWSGCLWRNRLWVTGVLASLGCLQFGSEMFSFYWSVICSWMLGPCKWLGRIEIPYIILSLCWFLIFESVSCSVVSDFVTSWTVVRQAPLFMEFSRQEYWARLPFPSPGDFPDSGIVNPLLLGQVGSLPLEPPGLMHGFPFMKISFTRNLFTTLKIKFILKLGLVIVFKFCCVVFASIFPLLIA